MRTFFVKACIYILLVLLSSACTQSLYTSLNIMRPAQVNIDKSIRKVVLVNNSFVQAPQQGHTLRFAGEAPQMVRVNTDSMALYCLAATANELSTRPFFQTTQYRTTPVNPHTEVQSPHTIPTDTILKLCREYQADAVISLDNLTINDDITEYFIPELFSFMSNLELKFETSWSIHCPNLPTTLQLKGRDTVSWQSYSNIPYRAVSNLPSRADCLIDAAMYAGRKTANRLTPYWVKSDRYFFVTRNKYLRQGMDSVYDRKWTQAATIWKQALHTEKTSLKAYAENNIAIAYEIEGNIDAAIEMQQQALNDYSKYTFYSSQRMSLMSAYLNELIQRKNDIRELNKQLGVNY